MKIALDAMGGDHAPRITIEGACLAAREYQIPIILVGDEPTIRGYLKKHRFSSKFIEIVHASQNIEMSEKATSQLRSKTDTSMRVALELMRDGKASAVVSAGHTGAFLGTSLLVLKRLPGVERPAITGCFPTLRGSCVMVDLGANVDCKPSHLVDFAIMGDIYARTVEKKKNPSIALLSNGEESSKGNELTRQVHELLKERSLNYIGFAESKQVFRGEVDVVVCDGFVGNIFLKTVEALVSTTSTLIRQEIKKNLFSKAAFSLFYLMFRGTLKNFGRRLDYSEYGAAPLLGLNGLVYVCHGRSNAKAIKNALYTAHQSVQGKCLENLTTAFSQVEQG